MARNLRPGDRVKIFFPPKPEHVIEPPKNLDGETLTGPNGKPWQFDGEYMWVHIMRKGPKQPNGQQSYVGLLSNRRSVGGWKYGDEIQFNEQDILERRFSGFRDWITYKAIDWMKSI